MIITDVTKQVATGEIERESAVMPARHKLWQWPLPRLLVSVGSAKVKIDNPVWCGWPEGPSSPAMGFTDKSWTPTCFQLPSFSHSHTKLLGFLSWWVCRFNIALFSGQTVRSVTVPMGFIVVLDMTPWSLINRYQGFGESCFRASKTMIPVYQTTRHYTQTIVIWIVTKSVI